MNTALILRASGQLSAETNAWLDEKFAEYDTARAAYVADRTDANGDAIVAIRNEVNSTLRVMGYGA